MLKILEVHPARNAHGEYVVLQHCGLTTLCLRGWALSTDAFLDGDQQRLQKEMYIFKSDIALQPYTKVVLFTGSGEDGWMETVDGRQAYCAYWDKAQSVWVGAGSIHLIHLLSSQRVISPADSLSA